MLPSLRTSYLVLPRALLAQFRQTAELTESGQPLLTQKILAAFLSEGHFYKHLKKMRNLYSARRGFVLAALAQIYPQIFNVEVRDGGMHIIAFFCVIARRMWRWRNSGNNISCRSARFQNGTGVIRHVTV